jgi:hypothetical protein
LTQGLDIHALRVHRPQSVWPDLRFADDEAFHGWNHLRSLDDLQDPGNDTVRVDVHRSHASATDEDFPPPEGVRARLTRFDARAHGTAASNERSGRGARRVLQEISTVRHGCILTLMLEDIVGNETICTRPTGMGV